MINIRKLTILLSKKDRFFVFILIMMSILLSLIETVGISAIMPFISIASNNDLIYSNEYLQKMYTLFNFEKASEFVFWFGISLIVFYFIRALYTTFYTYTLNKFIFGRYHYFACQLLDNYISMEYKKFVNKNSSTLTKTIINEANNSSVFLQSFLTLFSEIFTIIFLYLILIYVDYQMTIVLTVILGVKIIFLTKTISKVIKKQGIKRSEYQNIFYKILGQTFGNFKFIKLKDKKSYILEEFEKASIGFSRTNIVNNTLQVIPRTVLETLGFGVLIAIVLYILIQKNDTDAIIPIISMYALALYRILPALNRILSSYNQMMYLSKALDIVHEDLSYKEKEEGAIEIEFKHKIELNNVAFSYDNKNKIFENVNLLINKGEKVAFIGPSGSGKSTLVDIIIGIYKPEVGEIKVDGSIVSSENIKAWRKNIGYIPQAIYLFDGTVAENIAFGDNLDEEKVIEVLKKANIYDFLIKQLDGIYTKVGEGGIKLSGGQKQRIGIARALYNGPEILVLDEATSALDNETESKIMEEIYKMSEDKTLIVIAHRLSTIRGCQKVIDVSKFKSKNEYNRKEHDEK